MLNSFVFRLLSFVFLIVLLAACKHDDMADQPKPKPYAASSYYPNGASERPLVDGTVTTNGLLNHDNDLPWSHPVPENSPLPFTPTLADLHTGQQLFNIYCTPCHGFSGDGDGIVVQRGFSNPPSYHSQRMRAFGPAHFYNVMTNGWGAMYSFKDKIKPEDRWRVAAYIQALQLSQYAPAADAVPATQPAASTTPAKGGGHE